jgi:hypothetical protein
VTAYGLEDSGSIPYRVINFPFFPQRRDCLLLLLLLLPLIVSNLAVGKNVFPFIKLPEPARQRELDAFFKDTVNFQGHVVSVIDEISRVMEQWMNYFERENRSTRTKACPNVSLSTINL